MPLQTRLQRKLLLLQRLLQNKISTTSLTSTFQGFICIFFADKAFVFSSKGKTEGKKLSRDLPKRNRAKGGKKNS